MLDASGDIASATDAYALAQDAASAIRLFSGEYWFDTSLGVPYVDTIFGKLPPLQLIKSQLIAAALTVPGVASADCFISSVAGRTITGQVQIVSTTGQTAAAGFTA